jgi:prophage tail gpP-like protein
MHWDVGDGRIVISAPNDTQDPQYFFNMKRRDSGNNNILKATRVQDFSGIPTSLGVYGVGGQRNFSKARVGHIELDDDVIAAGFYRPVIIIAEGIKRQDIAERTAARELSARQKMKDNWNIEVDGFSYWDSQTPTNYATDTVAQVETDVAGGNLGAYYIHRVTMRRGPDQGDVTSLTMLRRGIWKL